MHWKHVGSSAFFSCYWLNRCQCRLPGMVEGCRCGNVLYSCTFVIRPFAAHRFKEYPHRDVVHFLVEIRQVRCFSKLSDARQHCWSEAVGRDTVPHLGTQSLDTAWCAACTPVREGCCSLPPLVTFLRKKHHSPQRPRADVVKATSVKSGQHWKYLPPRSPR